MCVCISSKTWQQISASENQRLTAGENALKEDGEFWMSFVDFTKHFTDFEMCNISVDVLYEDESGQCVCVCVCVSKV